MCDRHKTERDRDTDKGNTQQHKEGVLWNGIEGLDTDLSRTYVVGKKVAEHVDYVLLSIKVAPEFPRAWHCISIGDD